MSEYVPKDGVDEDKVIGSPEGDGDFETDNLTTNETTAGGQLDTGEAERVKSGATRTDVPGPQKPGLLEQVIDEISTGKIIP